MNKTEDYALLEDIARENNVVIVGQDSYMPHWYVLSCNKMSKGNAMEMANKFHETGNFKNAQPDLMEELLINCVNDTHFNAQWHLKNTGQSGGKIGSDIKACEAWEFTKGCGDIIVAVVDEGLELNHPDLINNLSPISFDTHTNSQPSTIRGIHGTPVGGIIGARANNNLGVAGVAPNVKLMSISVTFNFTLISRVRRAAGINFAWQNGADVINCSWSTAITEPSIDNAIQNATTNGRGGLGTVVVFTSGNNGSSPVEYPSQLSSVISVGSSTRIDQWATFSNYGTGLDVVAPGEDIYTTDLQGAAGYNISTGTAGDYHGTFGGTSSSAPQVAGIAALILSMNPTLTRQQVKFLIESTADRVGPYSYSQGAGEQPGLRWSSQMGYGRVNALKALSGIYPISGPNTLCNSTVGNYTVQNLPTGYNVTGWSVEPTHLFLPPFSGTGSTATLTGASSIHSFGQASITFTVATNCGEIKVKGSFWVGRPAAPGNINGNISPNIGSLSNYIVPALPMGATSMTWVLPYCFGCSQPWSFYSGQTLTQMVANVGDPSGYVQAMGNNSCGNCGASLLYEEPSDGGGCSSCPIAMVFPNPASEELVVAWIDKEGKNYLEDLYEYEISLYDVQGVRLFEVKDSSPVFRMDVRGLKSGFYYLHILNKDGLIRRQIRVEK